MVISTDIPYTKLAGAMAGAWKLAKNTIFIFFLLKANLSVYFRLS